MSREYVNPVGLTLKAIDDLHNGGALLCRTWVDSDGVKRGEIMQRDDVGYYITEVVSGRSN